MPGAGETGRSITRVIGAVIDEQQRRATLRECECDGFANLSLSSNSSQEDWVGELHS
jgi:hypothetical protein